jgi:hypothetical protein
MSAADMHLLNSSQVSWMEGQPLVVWLSLSMNLSLKLGLALAFASSVCNNGPVSVALAEPLQSSIEREKIKHEITKIVI